MMAFRKRGWDTYGTDPDVGYVAYGIRNLQADLTVACAEDMKLEPNTFDFILITGSLEHVFDSNKVLAICRRASKQAHCSSLKGAVWP
jgi:ubiquinone/menaquinone biosynthesis C-methylase UbiE